MPSLSAFYGLIIWMYSERGGQHNKPHIHVEYGEDELVISLDGEILEGGLPRGKMKLLEACMEIHRDELYADWTLLSRGDRPAKIEPLR